MVTLFHVRFVRIHGHPSRFPYRLPSSFMHVRMDRGVHTVTYRNVVRAYPRLDLISTSIPIQYGIHLQPSSAPAPAPASGRTRWRLVGSFVCSFRPRRSSRHGLFLDVGRFQL